MAETTKSWSSTLQYDLRIEYCITLVTISYFQDLQPQERVPLLLSTYQVYAMSRASTNIAKQLLPEVNFKTLDMHTHMSPSSV